MAQSRPPTTEEIRIACEAKERGATRAGAAEACGVSRFTLSAWLVEHEDFKEAWSNACRAWANELAENLVSDASAPLPEDKDAAKLEIQKRRLVADQVKWVASKLLPKVYGDRLDVQGTITHELSPLAQLRKLESTKPKRVSGKVVPVEQSGKLSASDCI